jgi:hypothetical protein
VFVAAVRAEMTDPGVSATQAAVEKVLRREDITYSVTRPGILFLTHKATGIKMTLRCLPTEFIVQANGQTVTEGVPAAACRARHSILHPPCGLVSCLRRTHNTADKLCVCGRPAEKRLLIGAVMCKLNKTSALGNWEIDMNDGEVRAGQSHACAGAARLVLRGQCACSRVCHVFRARAGSFGPAFASLLNCSVLTVAELTVVLCWFCLSLHARAAAVQGARHVQEDDLLRLRARVRCSLLWFAAASLSASRASPWPGQPLRRFPVSCADAVPRTLRTVRVRFTLLCRFALLPEDRACMLAVLLRVRPFLSCCAELMRCSLRRYLQHVGTAFTVGYALLAAIAT